MKSAVISVIVLMCCLSPFAADFSDYERIAISSPLITQVFTNPEIADVEDVQLQADTQIMLYEELASKLCKTLDGSFNEEIEFICFNDIQQKLDTESWNEFNKEFTGQSVIESETASRFSNLLEANGVFNTYLMFSYYENSGTERNLEIHLEWYLVDLASGESVLSDNFDCKDKFDHEQAVEKELECFDNMIEYFAELGK